MRRYFNYEHKARGAYILTALEKYLRNGDAYFASEADAFRICQLKYKNVSLSRLKADFDYLLENGDLVFEGSRLYLHKVQRYEDFVASELTSILSHNVVPTHPMVGDHYFLQSIEHHDNAQPSMVRVNYHKGCVRYV